jgi:hypothetical protein
VKHGYGVKVWANGDRYEGEWREGTKHGKYFSASSFCQSVQRSRHVRLLTYACIGKGTYTWANGDRYIGEWCDDKKHGKGAFHFANGRRKEGMWENDLKHVPALSLSLSRSFTQTAQTYL